MHEYPRQHIEETAKKLGFKDFIDPVDLVRFVKHHDAHVENRDQVYRSLEWLHGGTYLKFGDDESIGHLERR